MPATETTPRRCSAFPSGFLMRFFSWMNKTFPNPQHKVENAAAAATAPQHVLTCLFTFVPPSADIVFLEFGSTAKLMKGNGVELLVRTLLSLPSRPVVVFLTVRCWCRSKSCQHRAGAPLLDYAYNATPTSSGLWAPSVWQNAEDIYEAICRHYGAVCLSQFAALAPLVYSTESSNPLKIQDFAFDGTHPTRRGSDILGDIMISWLRRSLRATNPSPTKNGVSHQVASSAGMVSASDSPVKQVHVRRSDVEWRNVSSQLQLPRPLLPNVQLLSSGRGTSLQSPRCYQFGTLMAKGKFQQYSLLKGLPWHTAFCSDEALAARQRSVEVAGSLSVWSSGCDAIDTSAPCPETHAPTDELKAPSLRPDVPSVWLFCLKSVPPPSTASTAATKSHVGATAAKIAPGAIAFRPGATIAMPVTLPLYSSEPYGHHRPAVSVGVDYLTSYSGNTRPAKSEAGAMLMSTRLWRRARRCNVRVRRWDAHIRDPRAGCTTRIVHARCRSQVWAGSLCAAILSANANRIRSMRTERARR